MTVVSLTPSDAAPELARHGNLQVVAKLISMQFSFAAVKISFKENGSKLEFTGTEENLSRLRLWLADRANEFICRPYVISHPLMAYLLNQRSHSSLMSHIVHKLDCLIAPARDHADSAVTKKLFDDREVKLSSGHVVRIAIIQGEISSQNVDVLLKPIFRASDFAKLRQSFAQDANAVASTDITLLAEPGLLLCKHVLYALFKDTDTSSVSHQKAANRFFQQCFEAIRLLDVKTMAVPADALCNTRLINGDLAFLQTAAADVLTGLKPSANLKLKEIRLVTSLANPATTRAKLSVMPKIEAIPYAPDSTQLQTISSSSRPNDQRRLNFANGVTVSLIQDDIAKVDAKVLVSCTQEGTRDLSTGGASCRAIFAAGGAVFHEEVKLRYPIGLPAAVACVVTYGLYGSLKCSSVVHVGLPACPRDVAKAEEIIKAKAAACLNIVCGVHSIAFPVIGAGGMGYPADVVARGLLSASAEWALSGNVSRLQDIRFVVHTSDQTAIQAFQGAFRNHSSQISGSSRMAALKLGSIKVIIDQSKLNLSQEQLLFASFQNDALFASEWLEAIVSALVGADRYRIASVVIPIQKGALEAITPAYLADLFFTACVRFEATSPKHLRTLRPYFENFSAGAAFSARMADLAKLSEKSEPELWQRIKMAFLPAATLGLSKSTEKTIYQLNELEAKLSKFGISKANHPCYNVDLTEYSNAQSPGDYVIYGKADGISKAIGMLNDIQTPLTKGSVQMLPFDYVSKGFTQTLTSPDQNFCLVSKPGTITADAFMALICDTLAELSLLAHPSPLHKDVVWYLQSPDTAWHLFNQREAAALEHLSKAPNSLKREAHFASFDFARSTVTVGNNTMRMLRHATAPPAPLATSSHQARHAVPQSSSANVPAPPPRDPPASYKSTSAMSAAIRPLPSVSSSARPSRGAFVSPPVAPQTLLKCPTVPVPGASAFSRSNANDTGPSPPQGFSSVGGAPPLPPPPPPPPGFSSAPPPPPPSMCASSAPNACSGQPKQSFGRNQARQTVASGFFRPIDHETVWRWR